MIFFTYNTDDAVLLDNVRRINRGDGGVVANGDGVDVVVVDGVVADDKDVNAADETSYDFRLNNGDGDFFKNCRFSIGTGKSPL